MARKDTSTVEELEATEAAVEASTEPATEASTETAEKVEPDLTAFNQAADEAIVSGDFDAVNAEYNKLDRAGKAKATSHVNAEIKRQLTEVKDKDAAFAWGQLGQALKTTKPAKEKVERVPVNRTESVVETLASLYLAYSTRRSTPRSPRSHSRSRLWLRTGTCPHRPKVPRHRLSPRSPTWRVGPCDWPSRAAQPSPRPAARARPVRCTTVRVGRFRSTSPRPSPATRAGRS
jgi:hypothetical protein